MHGSCGDDLYNLVCICLLLYWGTDRLFFFLQTPNGDRRAKFFSPNLWNGTGCWVEGGAVSDGVLAFLEIYVLLYIIYSIYYLYIYIYIYVDLTLGSPGNVTVYLGCEEGVMLVAPQDPCVMVGCFSSARQVRHDFVSVECYQPFINRPRPDFCPPSPLPPHPFGWGRLVYVFALISVHCKTFSVPITGQVRCVDARPRRAPSASSLACDFCCKISKIINHRRNLGG